MDFDRVKKLVEDNYNVKVSKVTKRKNVYRIRAGFREYCLKVINYEFGHFNFILSAIKHLEKNGFKGTPKIILTTTYKDFVEFDDKFAYLTDWMEAREANYDNMQDLILTAKKLRQLHECSKGFRINDSMKPRVNWGCWQSVYETRLEEILDFKKKIEGKEDKTEFDRTYLRFVEEELECGKKAITDIEGSTYKKYMAKEVMGLGFCHHDLANHNILVGKDDEINIIDFDYCILDSHLHDVESLCMRAMRNGQWNIEKYEIITRAYSDDGKGLTKEEEGIILGFLEFPQDYWQVGLQYYWEKLPWTEERFMGRLRNYLIDKTGRKAFIETLRERCK
ncbi:MAG: CotS family spore coat protein [Sarcina sp.]